MVKLSNAFSPVRTARATPKGAAGYDNARENIDPHIKTQALSTSEAITKRLKLRKVYHAFGGFEDVMESLVCIAGAWTFITNATNTLWVGLEADGITMVNDQMVIANAGDYYGTVTIIISGLPGKDFHLRVYNITQSKMEGFPLGVSTTGAANSTAITLPIYIEADAGDVLEMQIKSADGTNPTLNDSVFYVSYLHE